MNASVGMPYRLYTVFLVAIGLVVLTACEPPEDTPTFLVRLELDGSERVYQYTEPITVEQFLRQVDVELSPLDRVNPERWTQIYDQIHITVVRVEDEEYCEEIEIPFRQQTQLDERLPAGEERIGEPGQNGVERVCYRVLVENGVRQDPTEVSRIVTSPPVNEVVFVGPSTELEPVTISGTLAYIANNNAWIIRGTSQRRRQLTFSSDLDRRVFSLSDDGRQMLFARETGEEATFNQLWLIPDTIANTPDVISLIPRDVLYAEWIPGLRNQISYSTAEKQDSPPGWRAFNDLWVMSIDPTTGEQIRAERVLDESSGGIYGWWGTDFEWSPDGSKLAWIRADSVGLVDLEDGELREPLLSFVELNPLGDWSWRTTVSWSGDSNLIATTVHGPPVGNEPATTSPVFNIAVAATDRTFSTEVVDRAGIWSSPRFSPIYEQEGTDFSEGYIAYLQARDWEKSRSDDYDLILADRDGSNARIIFPDPGQPGLRADQFANDFAWSPDGKQIAIIYQGNLWIIDVSTEIAYQITQDGSASKPVWTQ
jgi:WD40 repeat protein